MRLRLLSGSVLGLMIVFLMASPFLIRTAKAAEPTLEEILSNLGFNNIAESTVQTFPPTCYEATLYAEFAGYHETNDLSYYTLNTTDYTIIFSGSDGGYGYISPPVNTTFTHTSSFGLSLYCAVEDHRYFTEHWKNPDGQNHSRIYENLDEPGMYLIGFENLYGLGDRDYNDMVFSLIAIDYTLTVSSSAGGSTTPASGAHVYPCSSMVDVTAVADACYVFDHWELDGFPAGSSNPITVHMDDDHSLHAVFVVLGPFTLTIQVEGTGTTDPEPGTHEYDCCNYVTVTANETSPDCWPFSHWELDGSPVGSSKSIEVHIDSDHVLRAIFVYEPETCVGGASVYVESSVADAWTLLNGALMACVSITAAWIKKRRTRK